MTRQARRQSKARLFRVLHQGPDVLLMPNPWDVGSAKLLASLGFEALATTSGGFAATLGRLDGSVTRDEALAHAAAIVAATDLPVSADLENCFADDPDGVSETVGRAVAAGLAGCSVEDFTRRSDSPIYEPALAAERVAAAAEAAHGGPVHLVLTARAENHLHGRPDLGDTIARLQAYQEAGADVLYAPGVTAGGPADAGRLGRPARQRARPARHAAGRRAGRPRGTADLGGRAFASTALGAVVEAARELRERGTYGYWDLAGPGSRAARAAFAG